MAVVFDDNDRNRLTRRQLCDPSGTGHAIKNLKDPIAILLNKDRRHSILERPEVPYLLMQFPRIDAACATRRESQIVGIDLLAQRTHFFSIRRDETFHNQW